MNMFGGLGAGGLTTPENSNGSFFSLMQQLQLMFLSLPLSCVRFAHLCFE